VHFAEYLKKTTEDIYRIFCTHQGDYILNMSIHTRSSNFISYSGAIWRILTTIVAGAPFAAASNRFVDPNGRTLHGCSRLTVGQKPSHH